MDCADDADPFDCTKPRMAIEVNRRYLAFRAVVGYQLSVISFFEIHALILPNNQ